MVPAPLVLLKCWAGLNPNDGHRIDPADIPAVVTLKSSFGITVYVMYFVVEIIVFVGFNQ